MDVATESLATDAIQRSAKGREAAPGIGDQGLLVPAFLLDREKGVVRVGGPRTAQAFLGSTEVVVDRREEVITGYIVEEYRCSLAAALEAGLELGVSLGESPSLYVGSAKIKASQPRI